MGKFAFLSNFAITHQRNLRLFLQLLMLAPSNGPQENLAKLLGNGGKSAAAVCQACSDAIKIVAMRACIPTTDLAPGLDPRLALELGILDQSCRDAVKLLYEVPAGSTPICNFLSAVHDGRVSCNVGVRVCAVLAEMSPVEVSQEGFHNQIKEAAKTLSIGTRAPEGAVVHYVIQRLVIASQRFSKNFEHVTAQDLAFAAYSLLWENITTDTSPKLILDVYRTYYQALNDSPLASDKTRAQGFITNAFAKFSSKPGAAVSPARKEIILGLKIQLGVIQIEIEPLLAVETLTRCRNECETSAGEDGQHPEFNCVLVNLAKALQRCERFAEASEICMQIDNTQAQLTESDNITHLLTSAEVLLVIDEFEAAREKFDEAVSLLAMSPSSPFKSRTIPELIEFGFKMIMESKSSSLVNILCDLLSQFAQSDQPEAKTKAYDSVMRLANLLEGMGEYSDQLRVLKIVAGIVLDIPDFDMQSLGLNFGDIGASLKDVENYPEALSAYKLALRYISEPTKDAKTQDRAINIYLGLIYCLSKTGQVSEALNKCNQALKLPNLNEHSIDLLNGAHARLIKILGDKN